jgi:hypothetical protein
MWGGLDTWQGRAIPGLEGSIPSPRRGWKCGFATLRCSRGCLPAVPMPCQSGPAVIALATAAKRGWESTAVSTQVAPASSQGAVGSPAAISTTTLNGSLWLPRSAWISATICLRASGSGRSMGKTPSQRAARSIGRRRVPHRAATHTGIRGRWTGVGSNSPSQNALSLSSAWSNSLARSRGSTASPKGSTRHRDRCPIRRRASGVPRSGGRASPFPAPPSAPAAARAA